MNINFIVLFDYFCSCQHNLTPDFSFDLTFIGKRSCYAPEFVVFLEDVPDESEVPGGDNEDFVIRKVNDFGVIIWGLNFLKVLVDVGIEGFLKFEVIQHILVRFVADFAKLKKVGKAVCLFRLGPFAVYFQRKGII